MAGEIHDWCLQAMLGPSSRQANQIYGLLQSKKSSRKTLHENDRINGTFNILFAACQQPESNVTEAYLCETIFNNQPTCGLQYGLAHWINSLDFCGNKIEWLQSYSWGVSHTNSYTCIIISQKSDLSLLITDTWPTNYSACSDTTHLPIRWEYI